PPATSSTFSAVLLFTATPTPQFSPLSLHDALPISPLPPDWGCSSGLARPGLPLIVRSGPGHEAWPPDLHPFHPVRYSSLCPAGGHGASAPSLHPVPEVDLQGNPDLLRVGPLAP